MPNDIDEWIAARLAAAKMVPLNAPKERLRDVTRRQLDNAVYAGYGDIDAAILAGPEDLSTDKPS